MALELENALTVTAKTVEGKVLKKQKRLADIPRCLGYSERLEPTDKY